MTARKTNGHKKKVPAPIPDEQSLQKEAEERLAHDRAIAPDQPDRTPAEFVHELDVYQIELEMQAEELRTARLALEESRDKCLDLYDFAPVGYLTLTDKALIQDVNLTGAQILGIVRKQLIGARFRKYIAPEALDTWDRQFIAVLTNGTPVNLELDIRQGTGTTFPARLYCTRVKTDDKHPTIRIAITNLSRQTRSETAIPEGSERYRLAIDAANDWVWEWNLTDGSAVFSPQWYTMLGYEPGELPACYTTWRSLVHPEDLGAVEQCIQAHIKKNEGYSIEFRMRTKQGDWRWILSRGKFIAKDSENRPVRMVGTHTDITNIKQAEEALRETTEYLQKMIDYTNAPIIVWDPEFRITRFNHAFEHLTQRTEQEFLGQPLDILFPPATREASLACIKKTLAGERWETVEIPIQDAEGIIHTVLWNSANILSDEAEVISTIAQGMDITARKRVEQELRESEEKARMIVEHANEAIIVVQDGAIRMVNPMTIELSGYSDEELLAMPYARLIHPDDQALVEETYQKRLRGEHLPARYRFRAVRCDGTIRWVEISVVLIHWDGRLARLLFVLDITERKLAEDIIELTTRKLALMNDVTYQYIQNKITGLRGYVELSRTAESEAERLSYIDKSDQVLADIHHLIRNTREYQEIGSIQPQWTSVEEAIRIATSLVSPQPGIAIRIAVDGLEMHTDPLIEKIFGNLIENAVLHGKKTKTITFSCEETPDKLIIACEDDGCGIADEVRVHLFDQMVGKNIRFGLFFVRECLALSGMTITETGSPGKGARFEIAVPKGMYRFTGRR
jgi:PAS domain S-box-containing protein